MDARFYAIYYCNNIMGVYTMYDVTPPNALYMAAVAFTAYGVHWFALGLNIIEVTLEWTAIWP